MATNLRLRADAEEALRAEAARSGRSQQEIIRQAIDRHLGITVDERESDTLAALVRDGSVRPPRLPYLRPSRRITLQDGSTTSDLLGREDRIP